MIRHYVVITKDIKGFSRKRSTHEGRGNPPQRKNDHLWSLAKESHALGRDIRPEQTFQSKRD